MPRPFPIRLLSLLLWMLALPAAAAAQVVHVANLTALPFIGWKRVTVDRDPPVRSGKVGSTRFVVGRQVGVDTHVVDLWLKLSPGQQLKVDLGVAADVADDEAWRPAPLPDDPLVAFGGPAAINGTPMQWVSLQADGAGYTAHLRARTGRMLCTDLWLTWYPDQPAWCHGEALVIASNPLVPDLLETVMPPGIRLTFGDAFVRPIGGEIGRLVAPGTTFADGQARMLPLTFVWPRHLATENDYASAGVASQLGIGAVGIERLLADGNPRYPAGFDVRAFVASNWAESLRRLHTWEPGTIGIPPTSGVTGAQENQVLVRGEVLLPGGAGAEHLTYVAAAKWANRPCHHLEPDGSMLDPSRHINPRLVMWDGRPHWDTGVSPDRLGKPIGLAANQVPGGWWGPDSQHWLINTLSAGCRLTGSPALQQLLATHAVIYPLQRTVAAGLSTSMADASRAVGYEGLNAVHFWRCLEDRALATRCRDWLQQRWERVLRPVCFGADVWGDGFWPQGRTSPWQQALGVYGMDLAGEVFAVPEMRQGALRAAKWVCDYGIRQEAGRWRTYGTVMLSAGWPVDPAADNVFYLFGFPMAVATVLRHEPGNERARSIWTQMLADAVQPKHTSWLPPLPLPEGQ